MPFSDTIVDAQFTIAGGTCEKCDKEVIKSYRGRDVVGAWEAHHKDGDPNNDGESNCAILCWPCHSTTF